MCEKIKTGEPRIRMAYRDLVLPSWTVTLTIGLDRDLLEARGAPAEERESRPTGIIPGDPA
jgi:hypothetical protein